MYVFSLFFLASENAAILKTRKRCDLYSHTQKIAAILPAIFWRLFCDLCSKLAIYTLRFENASDFSEIAIFWDAKLFFETFGDSLGLSTPVSGGSNRNP